MESGRKLHCYYVECDGKFWSDALGWVADYKKAKIFRDKKFSVAGKSVKLPPRAKFATKSEAAISILQAEEDKYGTLEDAFAARMKRNPTVTCRVNNKNGVIFCYDDKGLEIGSIVKVGIHYDWCLLNKFGNGRSKTLETAKIALLEAENAGKPVTRNPTTGPAIKRGDSHVHMYKNPVAKRGRPSIADLKEFRLFCEKATDSQLANIISKEKEAGRASFLTVAKMVAKERGIRKNPSAKKGIEPTQALREAAFVARDYHGGQGTALYRLSCGVWNALVPEDIHAALSEFEACAEQHHMDFQDAGDDDLNNAIESLTTWCKKHPYVERNPSNRKITDKITSCFKSGEACKIDSTRTDGKAIWLHGSKIVEKRADGVYITTAGYNTKTTKERLADFAEVKTVRGQLMLNGKPWNGDWIKVSGLAKNPSSKQWFRKDALRRVDGQTLRITIGTEVVIIGSRPLLHGKVIASGKAQVYSSKKATGTTESMQVELEA